MCWHMKLFCSFSKYSRDELGGSEANEIRSSSELFSIRRSDWKETKIVYGTIIIGINIISTPGIKGVG